MSRSAELSDSARRLEERLQETVVRCGRKRADVTLVAVSKTRPLSDIRALAELGVTDFGENRVQEAASKLEGARPDGISLHLIGHLQKNKAKRAAELFDVIHSVDSLELAVKLGQAASAIGKTLPIFVQIDLAGEATKHGLPETELDAVVAEVTEQASVELEGFMCIPPFASDNERTRPYFARLRELGERHGLAALSMGMSHDFEVAIEEGATHVRVGTALFGAREVQTL